jgi:membrane associated rhomboid family serine protease
MPPVIGAIITATLVAWFVEMMATDAVLSTFALWPLHGGFEPWQLVTYAFLHANGAHIALNMYGLWMFGRDVERLLGPWAFVTLYFASVVCAGATQLVVAVLSADTYPTIGASGGVFGVLLAFALLFPNRIIMLLLPPVALPAKVLVALFAALELTLGVTGSTAGVAHFAHLGGMLGGYLVIRRQRRTHD